MGTSFDDKLIILLKKDLRFVDNTTGDLIRSEIVNAALKIDKELISHLLMDKEIKSKFFTEIQGHWIFEINKFIEYIQDKNFLNDSYTKFKNKIGLNIGGKFLNERNEVSLVWPFKDCILEGGMTKEEEKKNEIFFNEILAQDEIDRLLDPKVLTNFKKYTSKGEEKVKDFTRDTDGTIKDNLIIKGNNLLALYSLKKEFEGKVKLIYIDPPYNTETDSFTYNDKFTHSVWLTFMKNRLDIAKRLLSDDGTILVQLDWHESHYCKLLLDEIFGRENLINEIIWCYTGPGSPLMKQFNRKHDTILWYRKGNKWTFNSDDIRLPLSGGLGGGWAGLDKKLRMEYSEKGKIPEDWWVTFPKKEDFLEEFSKIYDEYLKINDKDWLEYAVAARLRVDGEKRTGYLTEKPIKLIERLIRTTSNEGDIILDFFAGSGTTGFVSNTLNRQFILIEQLEDTQIILHKRFKNKNYIYFELMKYNEEATDKIEGAKDIAGLLKIWKEMCEKYFLNYDVDINKFNANLDKFKKLPLLQQKRILVEMLNKNQLYVNLSEIEDSQFNVNREDKELNKKFYKSEFKCIKQN